MPDPEIIIEGSSILELPDGSPNVLGDEMMEVVQFGVNVKLPLSVIRTNSGDIIVTAFRFHTDIDTDDPGTGYLKLNNAVPVDVMAVFVNETAWDPAENIGDQLSEMREGDAIRIQLQSDPYNFQSYRLTAPPIDNGDWWTLPCVYVAHLGPAFAMNAVVSTVFIFNAGGIQEPEVVLNIDGGVADSIYNTVPEVDGGGP